VAQIVVVDDERSMREMLQLLLQRDGHVVDVVSDVKGALALLGRESVDLVFTDLKLPDGSGMEVLTWMRTNRPEAQVIMMTAFATTENAVQAMRLGAYDYQLKPFKIDELQALTHKALEKAQLIRDNQSLRAQLKTRSGASRLIGTSAKMGAVLSLIEKVAPSRSNVLVEGESGTGKELVARAVHDASPRSEAPFVAINCAAIPASLIEAELFGHAAGAFTGAGKARPGLFEAAHGGTIFLDEIGEVPQAMQAKLLRAIQERVVRRIGEEGERQIDVRIIAATNKRLADLVKDGGFREDLFYRLNVVRIEVPPLRERTDDIPLLARAFVQKHAAELKKPLEGIAPDAQRALAGYPFPGNVRELENFIERAVALASGELIHVHDLPEEVQATQGPPVGDLLAFPEEGVAIEERLVAIERVFIDEALRRANGVKTKAAEMLGLSFRSLRYRLQKLGLAQETGKSVEPE
jgi:two-component system, NtrC family, response regulator PilR